MKSMKKQKGEIFAVGFAVIWGIQAILAGIAIVGSIIVVEKHRGEAMDLPAVVEQQTENR
jgi:hypothetical protein